MPERNSGPGWSNAGAECRRVRARRGRDYPRSRSSGSPDDGTANATGCRVWVWLSQQHLQYERARPLHHSAGLVQAAAWRKRRSSIRRLAETFWRLDGSQPSLQEVREAVREIRHSKAMLLVPGEDDARSAGSFFKNPVVTQRELRRTRRRDCDHGDSICLVTRRTRDLRKLSAAWLVEHAGFAKGYTRGAAGISRRHALADRESRRSDSGGNRRIEGRNPVASVGGVWNCAATRTGVSGVLARNLRVDACAMPLPARRRAPPATPVSSAPGRAEICRPTGKPSPVNPQGTDTEGQNSRLKGAGVVQ